MTLEGNIARAFRMSDEAWQRHANPWSVWTRFTALPFLVLACWSRTWLGWWALPVVVMSLVWVWLNPRIFPRPASYESWASKVVLGERIWLNRNAMPIPARHRVLPHVLNAMGVLGIAMVIWGVAVLELWPTLMGIAVAYFSKLWFADRMVWLYEDTNREMP
jgi:hypothetical protein